MRAMRRRAVLLTRLLGACGGEEPRPRNVLLVTLDTTRADRLSCYDAAHGKTPNLDALAAEGTRFDLAVSTASVTPVSHAAILTGLYNHAHGLRVLFGDGGYRLAVTTETLATVLAAQGFRTLAVHSAFPVSRFYGLTRGFAVCDDIEGQMVEQGGEARWDVARFQRRSDETTELVAKLDAADLGSAPFFLWVHYWDPHDVARLPPGVTEREARAAQGKSSVQPFYAEEVTFVDASLGRLFDELRRRGVYDDTLILVVADHGQGLMDHGWGAHRLLYQEQIRVPLIVRVPGVRTQPVVSELVRTVDLFPTVLDYLGLAPRAVSGRSLRPLLEGAPDAPRTAFADQLNGYDANAGMLRERPLDDFLYAVIDGGWKLIYRPRHFDASELYHLADDPREEHDLFREQPAEARRLLELLARERPWVAEPFTPIVEAEAAAARAALDQLGYTGSFTETAEWRWTCPAHLDERWEGEHACPRCGAAPIPVAP
jgi:arylsulfatase A-like enzyme